MGYLGEGGNLLTGLDYRVGVRERKAWGEKCCLICTSLVPGPCFYIGSSMFGVAALVRAALIVS